MDKNLQDDLEIILNYFLNGLKDIEASTGEVQPMMYEVNSALIRVKKLNIDDVSKRYSAEDVSNAYAKGLEDGEIGAFTA